MPTNLYLCYWFSRINTIILTTFTLARRVIIHRLKFLRSLSIRVLNSCSTKQTTSQSTQQLPPRLNITDLHLITGHLWIHPLKMRALLWIPRFRQSANRSVCLPVCHTLSHLFCLLPTHSPVMYRQWTWELYTGELDFNPFTLFTFLASVHQPGSQPTAN